MKNDSINNIINTTVNNGICCACGLCVALCPHKALSLKENNYGEYVPEKQGLCSERCSLCRDICPMDNNSNEDDLGEVLFSNNKNIKHSSILGYYDQTFVGGVADLKLRLDFPSGGLTTATLAEMLNSNMIDAAIAPIPQKNRPWFEMNILETEVDILNSKGSVYHNISHSDILKYIKEGPEKRYAIVALPCFAKGLRLAQDKMPFLKTRLKYIFSLTCGSCHSLKFADLMRNMLSQPIGQMNYRSKDQVSRTSHYSLKIDSPSKISYLNNPYQFGKFTNVGILNSCRFCDDITGELSDITFMDAWTQKYSNLTYGTNFVISRNKELSELILKMFSNDKYVGDYVNPNEIEQSQHQTCYKKKRIEIAARQMLPTHENIFKKRFNQNNVAVDEVLIQKVQNQMSIDTSIRDLLLKVSPAGTKKGTLLRALKSWWIFISIFYLCKKRMPGMKNEKLRYYLPIPSIIVSFYKKIVWILRKVQIKKQGKKIT